MTSQFALYFFNHLVQNAYCEIIITRGILIFADFVVHLN